MLVDGRLEARKRTVLDALQDRPQVEVAAVRELADRAQTDRPIQVAARLVQVERRERPVLVLRGEPEVREVELDVHHRVRLARLHALERLDLGLELRDLGGGGGRAGLLRIRADDRDAGGDRDPKDHQRLLRGLQEHVASSVASPDRPVEPQSSAPSVRAIISRPSPVMA